MKIKKELIAIVIILCIIGVTTSYGSTQPYSSDFEGVTNKKKQPPTNKKKPVVIRPPPPPQLPPPPPQMPPPPPPQMPQQLPPQMPPNAVGARGMNQHAKMASLKKNKPCVVH